MKRTWIILIGLYLCLGLVACAQSESHARNLVETTTPSVTLSPTKIPNTPTSTRTPFFSLTPPPTSTPQPNSLPPEPLLTASPSPTPLTCSSRNGQVEKKQLTTHWLPTPLEYRVYTPPCYDHDLDQRFPVLYLIHGYGYNDDQWDRLGADETADKLIVAGEIAPFIIVMPHDNNHNVLPPENHFGDALLYSLIRVIDANYRTIPSRQYRAIGGISRGGNWAFHLGLSQWSFFGAIGGHSSPLFLPDGPPQVEAWLDKIPPDQYPRIYLDIGTGDKWLGHIIRLEEMLDDHNVPHEMYIFPGGHTDLYWGAHIENYIRWYAKEW